MLVHGSFGWGEETWAAQRPLADAHRLEVVDRRGFGASPPTPRVDFAVDARDLEAVLGDEGAHLVGHSYGALGCLLAAARRPERVRSLVVVEPPAFALAADHPAVRGVVAALRALWAQGADRSPEAFRAGFLHALGLAATPGVRLKPATAAAVRASMTERLPDEARVPAEDLRRDGVPVTVVAGAWDVAPAGARERGGAAFRAVCEALAAALAVDLVVLAGAAHNPQRLGPPFNDLVAEVVARAERGPRRPQTSG